MPEPTDVKRLSRRLQRQAVGPALEPPAATLWWHVPRPRLLLVLGLGLLVSTLLRLVGGGQLPLLVVLPLAACGAAQVLLGAATLWARRQG